MPNYTKKARGFDREIRSRLWQRAPLAAGRGRDLREYNEYIDWSSARLKEGMEPDEILRLARLKYFGEGEPELARTDVELRDRAAGMSEYRLTESSALLALRREVKSGPVDELDAVRWVQENLNRSYADIPASSVPSRFSLELLVWANANIAEFIRTVWIRCLPSRAELDSRRPDPVDDGAADNGFLRQAAGLVSDGPPS